MERKERLVLHPSAAGWRAALTVDGKERFAAEAPSLAAVLEGSVGSSRRVPVTLAAPSRHVVFERMTLPCANAAELSEMIRLQFEKILPHPVEEWSFGWQPLERRERETALAACAAHEPELAGLFAPLGEPVIRDHIHLWAMEVAARVGGKEPACGLWREGPDAVFGIFQNGRLAYLELIQDPQRDVPRVLLSAAAAGAPTRFAKAVVEPELAGFEARFSALAGAPLAQWPLDGGGANAGEMPDFMPGKWRERAARRARMKRLRLGAGAAVGIYAALLIGAGVALGVGERRLAGLEREIAALHPGVDGLIERQSHWNALAPATEPERYLVELLFQTAEAFPTAQTRLTRFELTARDQFTIEGEADNARQAVAFAENLKKRPGLSRCRFDSGPPVLLPNEHARFRVSVNL